MALPLWMSNLIAYSLQIAILAAVGTLLAYVFRLRMPRVTLIYWQILLLACLFAAALAAVASGHAQRSSRAFWFLSPTLVALAVVLAQWRLETAPLPLKDLSWTYLTLFQPLWLAAFGRQRVGGSGWQRARATWTVRCRTRRADRCGGADGRRRDMRRRPVLVGCAHGGPRAAARESSDLCRRGGVGVSRRILGDPRVVPGAGLLRRIRDRPVGGGGAHARTG